MFTVSFDPPQLRGTQVGEVYVKASVTQRVNFGPFFADLKGSAEMVTARYTQEVPVSIDLRGKATFFAGDKDEPAVHIVAEKIRVSVYDFINEGVFIIVNGRIEPLAVRHKKFVRHDTGEMYNGKNGKEFDFQNFSLQMRMDGDVLFMPR